MNDIDISVVITTKNEEKNIARCIQSIKQQRDVNYEVIVVDNASEDKTVEIALKYTDKVYDKGPERSAQRNYGMIDISNGKYVMFIDADMILSPRILFSAVEYMNKGVSENIKALYISEIVLGKNFFSKVRRFERQFYDTTPIDGARVFLKSAFVDVGGFDINMSGPEDWDIDKKIKKIGNIGYLNPANLPVPIKTEWNNDLYEFVCSRGVTPEDYGQVIFHNESEFSLKAYIKKKKYYSKSFDVYISKWGKNDKDVKKQLGFFYRFIGVFIEKGKWKRLIKHPLLTLGMYFLRVIVGFTFLRRERVK